VAFGLVKHDECKQPQGEENTMINVVLWAGVLKQRLIGERGAGLAEYALLLFVIAVAAAGTIGLFGADIVNAFQVATDTLPSDPPGP
jgi:Flp pilus assembly pilin Flp